MNYQSKTDCLDFVKSLTEVEDTPANETKINAFLDDTAGVNPNGVDVYRPYFVAARILEISLKEQRLKRVESVTFTNLDRVVDTYYRQQRNIRPKARA
jgi:hypothetical protein